MNIGWAGRPTVRGIIPKSCWISRAHRRRRVRVERVESVMVTFRVLAGGRNYRGGSGDIVTMSGAAFMRSYKPETAACPGG